MSSSPRTAWQLIALSLMSCLLLAGCVRSESKMIGAPISGYNHTSAAINSFSVNGFGGPDVGPFQGGGKQSGGGMLLRVWKPGMKALVKWEKDPDPYASAKWPEPMFSEKWREKMQKRQLTYSRHEAMVDIPKYEKICSIKVHFLPCDQVFIDTGCLTPSHPEYPYKKLFQRAEPTECAQP